MLNLFELSLSVMLNVILCVVFILRGSLLNVVAVVCNFCLFAVLGEAYLAQIDMLLFYLIILAFSRYLNISKSSMFLLFATLWGLEYLCCTNNFFEILIAIEFVLFSIIGCLFSEKIITVSGVQGAIYFFVINVVLALIFVYNCIFFLNLVALISAPVNLNYLMILDILGYYFLIQFNIYFVTILVSFICLFLVGVLIFKLTIMPLAALIVIVYSEISLVLLLVLITIYKLTFLVVLLKIAILHISLLSQIFVYGLALYTIYFGILAYNQLNLKVVITYLKLIQISFILLGLSLADTFCYSWSFIYLGGYILQLISVFCILLILNYDNMFYFTRLLFSVKFISISKFVYLFIILISMLGLPPFLGFFTKFFLLMAVFNAAQLLALVQILLLVILTSIIYFQVLLNLFFGFKAFAVLQSTRVSMKFQDSALILFISAIAFINLLGGVFLPYIVRYFVLVYL